LWHAVKAVKKSVSKVSKGAKFSEGLSWSQQLADKVEHKVGLSVIVTNSLILKTIHNIVKAFHIECVFAQNIILGMLVNCRFTDHEKGVQTANIQLSSKHLESLYFKFLLTITF
jgi:hypothetical protein